MQIKSDEVITFARNLGIICARIEDSVGWSHFYAEQAATRPILVKIAEITGNSPHDRYLEDWITTLFYDELRRSYKQEMGAKSE